MATTTIPSCLLTLFLIPKTCQGFQSIVSPNRRKHGATTSRSPLQRPLLDTASQPYSYSSSVVIRKRIKRRINNDDNKKNLLPLSLSTYDDDISISNATTTTTTTIAGVTIPNETAKPLALLLFAQFILFLGVGAVIPTIPLYGREIGLSSATNGLVISSPALALLLLAKPSGEYADRARKPAMMWGMALIALSDLGTALSQSVLPLVVARLGLGAGRCVSESGERGMLADFASRIPRARGRVLALQQAVLALGIAIGAPVGGVVVETYGPRAAFLCVTFAALVALFLYNFLPETVVLREEEFLDSNDNDGVDVGGDAGDGIKMTMNLDTDKERQQQDSVALVQWSELLKDSKWRGLSIFEAGAKWGYAAKISSIPLIAASVLPGGAVGAGSLLSAAGLSGLAGAPIGGFLVDKFGAKKTMVFTGVVSGTALMSIPFFLQMPDNIVIGGVVGVFPAWAAFCTSVLTWSIAVAAQNPSIAALAQEIAPEGSEATAMALPRASGDAMYLFAPFLLGTVADISELPLGSECFVAGFCGLLGIGALVLL